MIYNSVANKEQGDSVIDDKPIYERIRKKIVYFREKHPKTEQKTTQKDLAMAIGIKRSTLTNIELGNQRPPIHVIYRLADYFGVELIEYLPSLEEIKASSAHLETKVDIGQEEHNLPVKARAVLEKLRKKGEIN